MGEVDLDNREDQHDPHQNEIEDVLIDVVEGASLGRTWRQQRPEDNYHLP